MWDPETCGEFAYKLYTDSMKNDYREIPKWEHIPEEHRNFWKNAAYRSSLMMVKENVKCKLEGC